LLHRSIDQLLLASNFASTDRQHTLYSVKSREAVKPILYFDAPSYIQPKLYGMQEQLFHLKICMDGNFACRVVLCGFSNDGNHCN
jgi:hypothetical protein